MAAQKETRALVGTRALETSCQKQPANRTRPAYSRQFVPGANSFAVLVVGWPLIQPPAQNVLVLPPDADPGAIDWHCLSGCHTFVMPSLAAKITDAMAVDLARALIRAGAASVEFSDGGSVWRNPADKPGVRHAL